MINITKDDKMTKFMELYFFERTKNPCEVKRNRRKNNTIQRVFDEICIQVV